MRLSSVLGGLAGACALALINESPGKRNLYGPQPDLPGMNFVAKLLRKDKDIQPLENKIQPASLVSDIVSNTLFFGMAEGDTRNQTFIRGALLGLGAGISAITLPQIIGRDEPFHTMTTKTKALTVVWYLLGGLVAAAAINALEKK